MSVPFGCVRIYWQISLIFVGLLPGASTLCGCTSSPSAASPAPASARTRSVSLRSHPDYKRAEKLFQEGKREGSRTLLAELLKSKTLSPQDAEFLNRQIAIVASPASPSPGISRSLRLAPSSAAEAGRALRRGEIVEADCGPRALKIAAAALGVKAEVFPLSKVAGTDKDGTSLEGLVRAANSLGMKAEGVQVDKDALTQVPTPAVVWYDGNHYVALLKVSTNPLTGSVSAVVHDPNEGVEKTLSIEELLSRSGGIVLSLRKS